MDNEKLKAEGRLSFGFFGWQQVAVAETAENERYHSEIKLFLVTFSLEKK